MLIYHAPEMMAISVIGAYYSDLENTNNRAEVAAALAPYRHPGKAEPLFPGWQSSWAPLENVAVVRMFFGGDDDLLCKNLLFIYANGAERALGQCRLQVDEYREYLNPSRFCSLRTKVSTQRSEGMGGVDEDEDDGCWGLQIVFADDNHDTSTCSHEKGEWECFSMVGTLYLFFNVEEVAITVAE